MTFRFGAFELSLDSGELRKHGILLRLAPQPLQVLTILIQHNGEIVRRDELQDRLWGQEQTSVEFDAGLNRCVRQIRVVLNDDADFPRYVETVPRRGYRFIAPVERTPAPVDIAPPVPLLVMPPSAPSIPDKVSSPAVSHAVAVRRRIWMRIAGVSLAVALAAIWLIPGRSKLSSDLNSVPLATAMGDQLVPTFSPDGRQVAFVWNGEHQDNFDIYLKLIGSSSAPLRLTTSPDVDYSPAWSPDGRWIAFCRGSDSYGGAILIIPALGGAERKVADLHALGAPLNRSISWTRDSRSLVAADRLAGETKKGLYVVNVETGERRQITAPALGEEDMHPAVSPDGRTIAFTRDTGRGVSSIMAIPFQEARPRAALEPPRRMQSGNFYNARPAWTPDSTNIVFASNANGNRHLWLAPVPGPVWGSPWSSSASVELRALGSDISDAAVSGLGQLVFTHDTFHSNIWKVDVKPDALGFPKPTPVAASTMLEQSPAVSPDGTRIAFESNLSGYSEIWTSRADGSNPVQLTSMQNPVTGSPDWSPDGNRIVFDSRSSGRPQIYSVASDGGNPSRLTSGNAASVVPRWSPDGRSIYYSSDQTGRMEIWQMPASGGAPRQITFEGGFAPMLSRDGESLYFSLRNSMVSSLWELGLATGTRTLVSGAVVGRAYAAAPDGVYFFVGATGQSKASLFFFAKRTSHMTPLFQSDKQAGPGMMLAADGHTLYFTQLDQNGHDLFFVKEFWK